MKRLKKHFGFRTLKTAIGAMIAVFISQILGLDYAANSGIIVILSVQSTKKKSKDLAIMRIGSTILALSIGTIVFSVLGFTAFAFGIYLLLFIPIAVKLKFHDGIVPCSVLVTHILSIQSVAFSALMNEMMQMLIGASIGFMLNLYIPSHSKKLEVYRRDVDLLIKGILNGMADGLMHERSIDDLSLYKQLEVKLKEGIDLAWKEAENSLRKEDRSFIDFFELRRIQFDILYHMRLYFKRMYASYEQTQLAAELTTWVADHFEGSEIPQYVFDEIQRYKLIFKEMALPKTREEFENRASLHEYINDLQHFLEVKSI